MRSDNPNSNLDDKPSNSVTQWFIEGYDGSALMIKVRETLFEKRSLQYIQIFDTESFGKMLVLDGKIQLTEKDEGMYHEMLVHVPLFSVDNPDKILVIGGGDGGSVREVLKHEPTEVIMVEIDREVVDACQMYIGVDEGALKDERVTVLFEDGIEFVRTSKEKFDVIIVDGTDPNPVSKNLIAEEFYRYCSKIANLFATQSQSPFVQDQYFVELIQNARRGFNFCSVYINYVPTYPLGLWSYLLASNNELNPSYAEIKRRWEERKIETKHYNPELHMASFALPEWLKKRLEKI
ncbi:spermidine synthase [Archaeoglobales archaeon]|nr:MAG: spermidine synthase [Archaeoglobales archaeon]